MFIFAISVYVLLYSMAYTTFNSDMNKQKTKKNKKKLQGILLDTCSQSMFIWYIHIDYFYEAYIPSVLLT